MALGFGFNKTKVLLAAEKYVQQGKLQNAIHEYQKVIKHDPKDLTVLNTIGDCYARLGQNDQALNYFRRVGDTYASDGFVVKAIAMYKKITKLAPGSRENILKLAELYTKQGLYNDARQQYVQLADYFVRGNDLDQAIAVFQKMLELDPENVSVRSKMAEVYMRMGRKDQAREIFLGAAESLYKRGTLDAADHALERVLSMDPSSTAALLLRARIAADSGNNARAIQVLEQIPNLDSRLDGLQLLLRVMLAEERLEEAGPLAAKLLSIHNNPAGLTAYVQALMAAGRHEDALRCYAEHCDTLLRANPAEAMQKLHASINQIKDNATALELLRGIYQRMGETSNLAEVTELLAHAWVQSGEYAKARDLYQHLATIEPENASHAQNYKQMVAKLGDDPNTRQLSDQEAGQALMVDELQTAAAEIGQVYPREVQEVVAVALTESELFDSYNMPARAIPALEAVLAQAPLHLQLNQRLASLYERAERYADAARCCEVLRQAYEQAGDLEQARQYAELVTRNQQRAGEIPASQETSEASAEASMEVAEAPADAGDWDSMVTVEGEAAPEPSPVAESQPSSHFIGGDAVEREQAVELEPLLEEVRFFISEGRWAEARTALAQCSQIAPGAPAIAELRVQLATAVSAASAPAPAPPAPVAPPADALSDLVMGLEEALPEEFGPAHAPARAAAPPPSAPVAAASAAPAAAAAAPAIAPEDSILSDIFAEFKEGVEDSAAQEAEDPDTHYNLGVAFKEMGLLDEAIGELQKVAHAIDRGQPFGQVMQAYTWLAQCFVDKGVPEASIKWYQKALQVPGIDEQTRTAIHYDMGSAHEAAGDRTAALRAFTEAYGSNIDYRDVAERIKALKG